MAGPFCHKPISNLRCSPIGLVPKKTGGLRLKTHLSHPPNDSINDYIYHLGLDADLKAIYRMQT
jgi:hypothetical protein